ncbi:MAG: SEL1-like repeat protein, partial [Muribaculaceae bacterium]|nr:SEL1-like repeat protein [Muribaculaceae bacterium]
AVLLIAVLSSSEIAARSPFRLSKVTNNAAKVENAVTPKGLDARQLKALEAVRQNYTQGRITADSVVNIALYHKAASPQLAEQCLKLVADTNTRAKAELGLLYTHFTTAYLFPGKTSEGERLLTTAANAGSNDAYDYLGVYYQLNKKYKEARECFEARGHKNNGMSLCIIGGMYEDGTGYKKDAKKACEYYRQSALAGDANGATKYAYSLQRPWFGEVSLPDAFFWFYVAGDMGNDAARSNLWLPLTGERYGDDLHTLLARKSLELVEQGHAGQSFSGEPLYKDGFLKGIKAREQAAEGGDNWSRYYLGSMNYNDDFLNQNYGRAAYYYEQIAKDGNLPAPLMGVVYERLGDMYRNGKGVKSNPTKAAKYTQMAANLGNLKAYKIVEGIKD